jgi:hypothetical protein
MDAAASSRAAEGRAGLWIRERSAGALDERLCDEGPSSTFGGRALQGYDNGSSIVGVKAHRRRRRQSSAKRISAPGR